MTPAKLRQKVMAMTIPEAFAEAVVRRGRLRSVDLDIGTMLREMRGSVRWDPVGEQFTAWCGQDLSEAYESADSDDMEDAITKCWLIKNWGGEDP